MCIAPHSVDLLGPEASLRQAPLRYERGSMILTSNNSYGDWGTIFAYNVIASAIVARLLHHSTAVDIKGESCRLKGKKKAGVLAKAGQQGG